MVNEFTKHIAWLNVFYRLTAYITKHNNQSKEPKYHSYTNPKIKINKNNHPLQENLYIKGINKIISKSNTTKINANKKKCKLKGNRAPPVGENPHSKGSLPKLDCRLIKIKPNNTRIKAIHLLIIIVTIIK